MFTPLLLLCGQSVDGKEWQGRRNFGLKYFAKGCQQLGKVDEFKWRMVARLGLLTLQVLC